MTAEASLLIVDDDRELSQMLNEYLSGEGFRITLVGDGAQAIERLAGETFDLVILDMGLQDGSGLELLPLLRGEYSSPPPVVLYSATEASREVAAQVEAALVKSRDSIEQLLFTVRHLARRPARAAAAAGKVS